MATKNEQHAASQDHGQTLNRRPVADGMSANRPHNDGIPLPDGLRTLVHSVTENRRRIHNDIIETVFAAVKVFLDGYAKTSTAVKAQLTIMSRDGGVPKRYSESLPLYYRHTGVVTGLQNPEIDVETVLSGLRARIAAELGNEVVAKASGLQWDIHVEKLFRPQHQSQLVYDCADNWWNFFLLHTAPDVMILLVFRVGIVPIKKELGEGPNPYVRGIRDIIRYFVNI
jgi:hypothetical protein